MKTILLTILVGASVADTAAAQNVSFLVEPARRAWFGFSYDPVRNVQRDAAPGVVVREVVSGSPAEQAGIAVGDTILRINDIGATQQFLSSLGAALSPGDEVRFEVRRAGRTRTLTVTAARPPADYIGLGARSGLLRIDGDSVRSLTRIFVDSAFASLDSLRVPDIWVSRGNVAFGARGDSTRSFVWGDSLFRADSANGFSFRIITSDSMWTQLDSMRTRMRFGAPLRFNFDSLFTGSGARFLYGPDSVVTWQSAGDMPFGMTLLGRSAIAGAELTRLDPVMGEQYFGVSEGVLVARVPDGTPAARAGLRAGDVITRANGTAVADIESLRREIRRTGSDTPVRLTVTRERRGVTIELRRE